MYTLIDLSDLNESLINEALSFGFPDIIAWYEKPASFIFVEK